MLNYFGNKELVPSGYVYTSHTGSKYVFLEGIWFHDSSTRMVDPRSYGNLYTSAQKQIFEHNVKSNKQIGKTYIREGKEQVFIGNGRYTHQGRLVESSFSNFTKADPNSGEIPDRFKLGDYTYNKKDKAWYNKGQRVNSAQDAKDLATSALKKMQEYNKTDEFPVNSTIKYKDQNLTWNGINWVDESGKAYGDKFAQQIYDYLDENPSSDESSTGEDKPQDKPSGLKKGSTYTDKNGRRYVYDGNQFVSIDNGTPLENSAEVEKQYSQDQEPKSDNPPDTTTPPDSTPPADVPPSNTGSSVPDGYIYTSGKGKQYYKKNGVWNIGGSKVNASAAIPLERAAAKKIEQENASSDLKIGQSTWSHSNGNVYTYVGGDRFIGSNGKLLPKDMAEKAKNDLVAKKDDHKEEDDKIKDEVDAGVDDTSTATPEDRKEEEKVDQGKAVDDNDAKQDDNQEQDKIKGLADKIKANPNARKIAVLLTRADKLSLMAADILLSGNVDKVKQILQTLNKRDE